jgi:hypothetical protein
MSLPQAMRAMNRRLNLPNLQNIMREFERQNERMEMTSEMMGDAVDDALGVRGACWGQSQAGEGVRVLGSQVQG